MNVQLELLEYSVQRPANAGMVESAITLVVPVSVSQDTQENAVKRGYALKVFMVSNVIKSVPVTFQILTGKFLEFLTYIIIVNSFLSKAIVKQGEE